MRTQPKYLFFFLASSAITGCMNMPADVAEELSPPDGKRPDNYANTLSEVIVDPARPEVTR